MLSIRFYGQTAIKRTSPHYLTTKYAGKYNYGKKDSRVGFVTIYPESDSTILFYFESNRGAPGYNSGSLYEQVKILNDTGIYYLPARDSLDKGCKFSFIFTKDNLILTTINNLDDCGFGYGVFVDGKYARSSDKTPLNFTDRQSKEVFFGKTKPQDYLK